MATSGNYYEVLYYPRMNERGDYEGDPITKEYKSKKQALAYYEKHKNDGDKFGWWVTYRDEDGYIIDDIII